MFADPQHALAAIHSNSTTQASMIAIQLEGCSVVALIMGITAVQAQTMELTCIVSSLADQSLQDLTEAFQASPRLRRLTLCDVPPNMLCMASGISRLEELSLADICGKDTDLGKSLEVMTPCLSFSGYTIAVC